MDDLNLKIIVDLVLRYYHPNRIILFGSRARGDHRPDSDYDICVEIDEYDNRMPVHMYDENINLNIDFVFIKNLDKRGYKLLEHIRTEGVLLWTIK